MTILTRSWSHKSGIYISNAAVAIYVQTAATLPTRVKGISQLLVIYHGFRPQTAQPGKVSTGYKHSYLSAVPNYGKGERDEKGAFEGVPVIIVRVTAHVIGISRSHVAAVD